MTQKTSEIIEEFRLTKIHILAAKHILLRIPEFEKSLRDLKIPFDSE